MSKLVALLDRRLDALLCTFGAFLIVLSLYQPSYDAGVITAKLHSSPNFYLLVIGLALLAAGIYLFTRDQEKDLNIRLRPIQNEGDGYVFHQKTSSIHVHFGLLQDIAKIGDRSIAIVLPANDLFDDACFDDRKTALGAYLGRHFSNDQVNEIKAIRDKALEDLEPTLDGGHKFYGAGTVLDLKFGLHRLLLTAVASQRGGDGLKTRLTYIFESLRNLFTLAVIHRIDTVYIPVLGAGKGGVPIPVAFSSLLHAALEAINSSSGHHVRNIHIVVFQPETTPELGREDVKQIAGSVLYLWRDTK